MKTRVIGVYLMINWTNGMHYVGSSSNVYVKWANHLYTLKAGKHTYQKEFSGGDISFMLLHTCKKRYKQKSAMGN